MLITQATEYAILGLINLAQHNNKPLKVAVIAAKEKVSPAFLGKIFQKLSRAKLIKATFGPSGGFELNKKPQDITLKDVILAVQGERLVLCFGYKPHYCQRNNCRLQQRLFGGQKLILSYFQKTTLRDLITKSTFA